MTDALTRMRDRDVQFCCRVSTNSAVSTNTNMSRSPFPNHWTETKCPMSRINNQKSKSSPVVAGLSG
jgi:hypothetical protein